MKPLAADDPRTIGEYQLQGRLGQGGMGRVYLGLSPAGRAVAVKVVHPQLASDTDFLRRFEREVQSARAVSGIYTAPVVATGLNEHPPWLATAFVPGPSLDQMVAEHGPLAEQALWPLLGGLVEALQAIHACGVVHRDLKPANVLLATDGPRLIDFGISRVADRTALTTAGVVFGTPGYMAPEQAEGKQVGPPADLFALGCVISFAATGTGPFGEGSAASVLYRVVHAEPTLDPMPSALRELVATCLSKDPAARPSPQALASSIAREAQAARPSATSFWPRPVADLIGTYQASLGAPAVNGNSPSTGPQSPPANAPSPPAATAQAPAGPQGYPSPRGYSAAQPPYPPPAGSAPPGSLGAGPAGYPRYQGPPARGRYQNPYQVPPGPPRPRGPRPPIPPSMLGAVRLMYAGAAHSVLLYSIAILTVNSIIKAINVAGFRANQYYVPIQADRVRGGVVAAFIIICLIEVALWLWMAWANKYGRAWARVVSTVIFGLGTIGTVITVFRPGDGTPVTRFLGVVGWLIACATIVLLWQPESSSFFKRPPR